MISDQTFNNNISRIFINTTQINETIHYLIYKLGFSKIHKRVLFNGKIQVTLNFFNDDTPIVITEIGVNENVPSIQFGLDYPFGYNTEDIILYLKSKGFLIKDLNKSTSYLGINCHTVMIDPSLPEFIIPNIEMDIDDYLQNLGNSNILSYEEFLELDKFDSSVVSPIIFAELLDLRILVNDLDKAVESLRILGFHFEVKTYDGLYFANSSNTLFELWQDNSIDKTFASQNIVFVLDAGIHFEYDGRVFANNEIPSPSFKYLKDNDFHFINEVFNSKGETISNLAYVKDVNNLIWEIRSWIKQEDYQFVG